jgi:hypothetical protein
VSGADRFKRLGGVGVVAPLRVRRKLDDPKDRAFRWRFEMHGARDGVGIAFVARRRIGGFPQIGESEARHRFHFFDVGGVPVDHEARLSVLVVAGHHASHSPNQGTLPLLEIPHLSRWYRASGSHLAADIGIFQVTRFQ